jgi:hypothetical protein
MGPSFDESLAKYKQFLVENGYSSDVVWVIPDDVLVSSGPVIYVRMPVSGSNEESVRRLFDLGMSQKKGVLFDTLCDGDGVTFSYAWVPRDNADAQESLMPKGLKLSAKTGTSRVPGRAVGSRLRWLYLQLKCRGQQTIKEQMFR